MTRIMHGAALPIPPIRAQNTDLLPDGTIDPAHATDCGEACVSSVIEPLTSFHVPIGCIRSILRLPQDNGVTAPHDLTQALAVFGLSAWRLDLPAAEWRRQARLRNHGQYAIILGNWVSREFLHWVLAYEHERDGVAVMDPWTGDHRYISAVDIDRRGQGVAVTINGWT